MEYTRPYYEDIHYRPKMFYVIFGISDEQPVVSQSRHHVDEFPAGLDLLVLSKQEHSAYMDNLTGGMIGNILKEENPALYEQCTKTEKWALLRGEVSKDDTLNYFRNVIGMIQALIDQGACGVLDLYTFTLTSAEDWTNKIFGQEFNPWNHVTILVSEDPEGYWLHTRGMSKFGRPDISLKNVPAEKTDEAAQLVNQMIWYGALGVFFARQTRLHIRDGRSFVVTPEFIDDFGNDDFNNAYYEISYQEE